MKSVTSTIVSPVSPTTASVSSAGSVQQNGALPPAQSVDTDNTEGAKQQRQQAFEQSTSKKSNAVQTHLSKESNQATKADSVPTQNQVALNNTTKPNQNLALDQIANLLKDKQSVMVEVVVIKTQQKINQTTQQLLIPPKTQPHTFEHVLKVDNQLINVNSSLNIAPGTKLLVNITANGQIQLHSPWQVHQSHATPALHENLALLEKQLSLSLPKQGNVGQALQQITTLFQQFNALLPSLPQNAVSLQSPAVLSKLMTTLQQLPSAQHLQPQQLQASILQSGVLLEGKLRQASITPSIASTLPTATPSTSATSTALLPTPAQSYTSLLTQAMGKPQLSTLSPTPQTTSSPLTTQPASGQINILPPLAPLQAYGSPQSSPQLPHSQGIATPAIVTAAKHSVQYDIKLQLQHAEATLKQDIQAVRAYIFGSNDRHTQQIANKQASTTPQITQPNASLMTYSPSQLQTKAKIQSKSTGSVQNTHLQLAQTLGKLHQQAIEAVARIQSQQSNALLQNTQQSESGNQHLQADLLFQHQGHLQSVNFEAEAQHDTKENDQKEKVAIWNIGLNFDIPDIGEFKANITFKDGKISVLFTAEEMNTLHTLNSNISKLNGSLKEKDVVIDTLQCLKGKLHKEKTHLTHHLIDIKT